MTRGDWQSAPRRRVRRANGMRVAVGQQQDVPGPKPQRLSTRLIEHSTASHEDMEVRLPCWLGLLFGGPRSAEAAEVVELRPYAQQWRKPAQGILDLCVRHGILISKPDLI